jgi:adenylate cyclase
MIGSWIEHYRIEALLGRGAMGEVYRATDTKLDRSVAIKLLGASDLDRRFLVERFLREARAASGLNHPHIVTIHDAGQSRSGEYYIVQELVEGETLRNLLKPRLPLERAIPLATQLAKALAAAHAAGIVHRDLKPENLMVRPDGYLKVLDFGLARQVTQQVGSDATTQVNEGTSPGTILGTTAYMSPEQATAQAPGTASDIFSFGIILYEMLTGVRPFTGDGTLAVLSAIVNQHPVPPTRHDPDVPPTLDALILASLAKAPQQRPSAEDLIRELDSTTLALSGQARPSAAATRLSVGRQREREQLTRAFEQTLAGRGRMIAITGEPGIGKTTLVEDVLADLAAGPHRPSIARGRCSERLAGTEAFLPIFEALDQLMHVQSVGAFGDIMRRIAPTWYVRVAPLAMESTGTDRMLEDARTASPERMKRELATFFQEVSRIRPLVLFVEDVHWADLSTTDTVNYLADRFDQLRVLIVVTYRPSDMIAAKHHFLQVQRTLAGRHLCEELSVEFLRLEDVERYLSLLFPGQTLPAAFGQLLYQTTEGSPLFMVDLVQYLREDEVIAQQNGQWVLARNVPDIARALPQTLKGTIARKIDQLNDDDRRLMHVASVQGYEFDARVLSDVLGLDAADTEERLADLAEAGGLIRLVEQREYPDRELTVRYRFVHVLYQNALFGSLQPARRAGFGLRVAHALETHFGDETPSLAATLAVLFETGRDFPRAARYFLAAVTRAVPLFAYREAVLLAERGLDMVKSLPAGPERLQLELGLLVYLGLCQRTLQGWAAPQVERIYLRAREICHQLGDVPELFPIQWGLTLFHALRGDVALFARLAEELLEQAAATGRNEFLIGAHQMMASSREFLGETRDSDFHFQEAIRRHDVRDLKAMNAMFGLDPGMIARSLGPRPRWFLGFADQALANARAAVESNRQQRQVNSLCFSMVIAQHIHLLRREPVPAAELGAELVALCEEYGLAQELQWARCYRGSALAQLGEVDAGVALLRDSLAGMQQISSGLLRPMFLALLAEGLLASGDTAEGLAAIDDAFAWGERSLERFYHAELWRVQGQLRWAGGDPRGAEESLRLARAHSERQGALGFTLRSLLALHRVLSQQGRAGEVIDELRTAYASFSEGFETGDLVEARDILSRASSAEPAWPVS